MLSFDKRYEKRNTLVLCFNFLHLHSVLICSTPSSQYIYNLRKPHWHKDCVLWRLHSFCLEIRKELRTLGFPNSSGGKESPAMQETLVRFLGRENRLEKGKATHSSILAWRIPWTLQSMVLQKVGHDWATFTFTFVMNWAVTKWIVHTKYCLFPVNWFSVGYVNSLLYNTTRKQERCLFDQLNYIQ